MYRGAIVGHARAALVALAATVALAAASPAQGAVQLNRTQNDYGQVAIGSASGAVTFMLSAYCDDDPLLVAYQCMPGGEPPVPVSIAAPAGFVQSNNCPAALPRTETAATCQISVSFVPPATGAFQGLLTTGDPMDGTPSAALSGAGVPPAPATKAKKKRKCKKRHRSAAAAGKKCAKRPKS